MGLLFPFSLFHPCEEREKGASYKSRSSPQQTLNLIGLNLQTVENKCLLLRCSVYSNSLWQPELTRATLNQDLRCNYQITMAIYSVK